MNDGSAHEGGCVCGAVRFKAVGEPLRVTVCHCRWCQRRTGSAFGVEAVFDRSQVTVTGDVAHHRHVSDESGRWLDMAFCPRCGGNLGLMVEAAPEIRSLPAGAFDDPAWITPERWPFRHIYVRSRRGWSDMAAAVEVHEGNFRR